MATFDPSVPDIEPKRNISSFSQGTEPARMQPLAEVPKLSEKYVSPDYKANTSVGKAFEGLGESVKADVGLVENIVKSNISDTLNDGIKKIQDGFGVAQAADMSSGTAEALGKAGAEGTLTGDTPDVPPELKKLGTRLDNLTEMYHQGGLSNSAYYGKMEAFTRQVIQQFPGFEDDVRQMASSKIGTNSANALRSSIQQDVTELAKKVQAQNDKWTAYEDKNSQYIHTLYPNYEQDKAAGKGPSRDEIRYGIGNLQARDYRFESDTRRLGAIKANDQNQEDTASQQALWRFTDIAGHLSIGATNSMGIKSVEDFNKVVQDAQTGKRAPFSPDEKKELTGIFATLEQQYAIDAQKAVNQTRDKDGQPIVPLSGYIQTPGKLQQLITQGRQPLEDLKAGIFDEKFGVMAQSAQWTKASLEAGETDFIRRTGVGPDGQSPATTAAAGRKFYGDNAAGNISLNEPVMQNQALAPYRQYNKGKIAQAATSPSSLKEVIDELAGAGIKDGGLNQAMITDTVRTILHPEGTASPELAGKNAVQHAYGPGNRTLLDAADRKDLVPTFNAMVSEPMTKKITHMDGKSQDTYYNFANEGFTSIYEREAQNINSVAANLAGQGGSGNVKLVYDPQSNQFNFKAGSAYQATGLANRTVQDINNGLASMKGVWSALGKDPTEELYRLLPTIGIEPGTPVYKAVQVEFMKTHDADAEGAFPAVRGAKLTRNPNANRY